MKKIIYTAIIIAMFCLTADAAKKGTTTIVQSDQPKSAQSGAPSKTPESIREDAFTKIRMGYDIFSRAQQVIQRGRTNENLKAGIELYAQAGQMFQEAYAVLNYLGLDYVKQADIDGAKKSMDACIQSINNAKSMITEQR